LPGRAAALGQAAGRALRPQAGADRRRPAAAGRGPRGATLAQADLGSTESWSFTDASTSALRYEIDPAWAGELPRTVMIDGDGKTTVLPGVADLARVRAWLDAQPKPRP